MMKYSGDVTKTPRRCRRVITKKNIEGGQLTVIIPSSDPVINLMLQEGGSCWGQWFRKLPIVVTQLDLL